MTLRLDALLTRAGYGTRSEVKDLIRTKVVTVDGVVCTSAKQQVEAAQVVVDGKQMSLPPDNLSLIFHKPLGFACSHDPDEAPIIDQLVPPQWRGAALEPAGRLDRMTSGLLVLSTDGQWIHRLIQPKKHVAKRYRVGYQGELRRDAVKRVTEGLQLLDEDRPCLPAALTLEDDAGGLHRATLVLHEGRYHQVRRMIAALGGQVLELHRDRIGALELPADLLPGQMREITDAERALCTSMPAT